ncbi:MAG: hypothetical protein FWF56_06740 [Firmicutes bacterium]|nr:hypothetical protein [Bacillota bacterium]MCL1953365.1 hypothetical protein [Bacillota bacterium]
MDLSKQDIKQIKKRLKMGRGVYLFIRYIGVLFLWLAILVCYVRIDNWKSSVIVSEIFVLLIPIIFLVGFGLLAYFFSDYYLKVYRHGKYALKHGEIVKAKIYGVENSNRLRYRTYLSRSMLKYEYELNGVKQKGKTSFAYRSEEVKYLQSLDSIKIKAYKNKSVVIETIPSLKEIQGIIADDKFTNAHKNRKEKTITSLKVQRATILEEYYENKKCKEQRYIEEHYYSELIRITRPDIEKSFYGKPVEVGDTQLFIPKDKDSYYIFSKDCVELFDRHSYSVKRIGLQYPYKYDFTNAAKWENSIIFLCGHKIELNNPNYLTQEFEILIKKGYINKLSKDTSINHEFEKLIENYYEYQELAYDDGVKMDYKN